MVKFYPKQTYVHTLKKQIIRTIENNDAKSSTLFINFVIIACNFG